MDSFNTLRIKVLYCCTHIKTSIYGEAPNKNEVQAYQLEKYDKKLQYMFNAG